MAKCENDGGDKEGSKVKERMAQKGDKPEYI